MDAAATAARSKEWAERTFHDALRHAPETGDLMGDHRHRGRSQPPGRAGKVLPSSPGPAGVAHDRNPGHHQRAGSPLSRALPHSQTEQRLPATAISIDFPDRRWRPPDQVNEKDELVSREVVREITASRRHVLQPLPGTSSAPADAPADAPHAGGTPTTSPGRSSRIAVWRSAARSCPPGYRTVGTGSRSANWLSVGPIQIDPDGAVLCAGSPSGDRQGRIDLPPPDYRLTVVRSSPTVTRPR